MSLPITTSSAGLRLLRSRSCLRKNLRSTRSPRSPRLYYSHEHPPPADPLVAQERAILAAAYRHVPEHGFSQYALAVGARDAGFPDISQAVLPDGPFSLILYHLRTSKTALTVLPVASTADKGVQTNDHGPAALVQRVEKLLWRRLAANVPVIHQWPDALAIMALPSNVPTCLTELAALADEIWTLAADQSSLESWFTRRAALSAIYASTELFMTKDSSPDFADTKRFLTRRLQEMQNAESLVGSLRQGASFTLQAVINTMRSKGAPL